MTIAIEPDQVDVSVGAPSPDLGRSTPPARGAVQWLFDGSGIEHWQAAGAGRFTVVGDRLESVPGDDLGLFWYLQPTPADFVLRLEWLRWREADCSGVFVRFPRPCAGPYGNPAFTAIQRGFEVRLDEVGLPGARAIHRTGAIFGQLDQRLSTPTVRPPAEWNAIEIAVRDQRYVVRLNGTLVSEFENRDPARGRPGTAEAPSFIGLQLSPGSRVAFRRIVLSAL